LPIGVVQKTLQGFKVYSDSKSRQVFPFSIGSSEHALSAAAGGRSLLDLSTQLGINSQRHDGNAGWRFTWWPECAEATLVWLVVDEKSSVAQRPRLLGPDGELEDEITRGKPAAYLDSLKTTPDLDRWPVMIEVLANLEAGQTLMTDLNWRIANGRAGAKSRRYFVRNHLRYMWVLTFAESEVDRRRVMSLVSEFARRLRGDVGDRFAYWYSPELHPGGHGWHVNFFITQRVPHERLVDLWGHGFVWVTDFASTHRGPKGEPLGLCRSPREGWRRAAQYGCKYSQKDWSPEHVGRQNHRYELAQGFAPEVQKVMVPTRDQAETLVAELCAQAGPSRLTRWDSSEVADWARPPVRIWKW
jgi:hypothetical protein